MLVWRTKVDHASGNYDNLGLCKQPNVHLEGHSPISNPSGNNIWNTKAAAIYRHDIDDLSTDK